MGLGRVGPTAGHHELMDTFRYGSERHSSEEEKTYEADEVVAK